MTARLPLFDYMPYGAPELLAAARGYMLRAQATSCALVLALFVAAALLVPRTAPRTIVELAPPTYQPENFVRNYTIPEPTVPPVPISVSRAKTGLIVPVTDEAPVDNVIAPPDVSVTGEIGDAGPPSVLGGEPNVPNAPPPNDPLPARGEPIRVDEPPVAITAPLPVYGELPREMGIEGKVVVFVLIGKDGRVLRAELDERMHIPVLDPAVLDAVKHWVYTPAMVGGHPVAVWERIPFEFTLH